MRSVLVFLTSTACFASCLPPPHPAVVEARHQEELLPPHLRSPALHNPHLQEILPLTSTLHHGENPVFEREAEKVSRQEIYNILTHAGFVRRRPLHHQPDPYHRPHQRFSGHQNLHHNPHSHSHHHAQPQQNYFESQFFANPELLQHL